MIPWAVLQTPDLWVEVFWLAIGASFALLFLGILFHEMGHAGELGVGSFWRLLIVGGLSFAMHGCVASETSAIRSAWHDFQEARHRDERIGSRRALLKRWDPLLAVEVGRLDARVATVAEERRRLRDLVGRVADPEALQWIAEVEHVLRSEESEARAVLRELDPLLDRLDVEAELLRIGHGRARATVPGAGASEVSRMADDLRTALARTTPLGAGEGERPADRNQP